ncbi:hypothetical protein KA005_80475, partial [bacterium]|nr:hypothetical protein [bacterium]
GAYRYGDKTTYKGSRVESKKKDLNFLYNIKSQVARIARYQQQAAPVQAKQITHGRQKGVLPIHITIPTGGRLFTFTKLISRDTLKINAFYSKGLGKIIFWLVILLIAAVFLRNGKWVKRIKNLIPMAKHEPVILEETVIKETDHNKNKQ